jgi:protein-L-isoaspartate(D-aspartate) O-methyltransferase
MVDFAALRRNMIDTQLRTYDVTSKRLLDAIESVGREHFVPQSMVGLAYTDQSVTLQGSEGEARVLLQPMILSRMLQAVDIQVGEKVLDVAGGSGYTAAIMAAMGGEVTALESSLHFSELAQTTLKSVGIEGLSFKNGDLLAGVSGSAPFDVIFINGAVEQDPSLMTDQLAEGGRLVVVMGTGRSGRVVLFNRTGDVIGRRTVFDAAAPTLSASQKTASFQF